MRITREYPFKMESEILNCRIGGGKEKRKKKQLEKWKLFKPRNASLRKNNS